MIATKDQKAETAAKAIMDNIILKFGCFHYLVSDRSRSWLNNLFQEFLKMPNMAAFHIKTSSFHPQTNSLCEQQNKHILRHLRAFCTDRKNFHEFLPAICAAINGTVNSMLCARTADGVVNDDYQTWLQRTRSCIPAAKKRCRSCGNAANDRVGLFAVFVQRSPYAAPIDGKPSDYACSGSGQSNGISLEQWPTIASRQAQPSAETKAHNLQGCNGHVGDEQAALTGRVHTSTNLQQDSVGDSLQMRPTVPAVIYSIADKATAERGTQAVTEQSNNSATAASSNTECTRTAAETKQPKVTQADAAQTKRAGSESDGRKTTTAVANANGSYTAVSPPVREARCNYCSQDIGTKARSNSAAL
jgi:hypothetical protein